VCRDSLYHPHLYGEAVPGRQRMVVVEFSSLVYDERMA